MSQKQNLDRIEGLTKLVLEHRLSAMQGVAAQLARSRDQLASITAAADRADLPPMAAAIVDVRYQRWADIRRMELNGLIARQMATLIEASEAAGLALGRQSALQKVIGRLGRKA